ncbi:MAG: hypothetical protein J0L57_01190 [Burkholderiales bacterium]|nr:hypothetical protein [Burkholderiales bacterium]
MRPFSKTRLALSATFVFCIVFNVELAQPEGLSLSVLALLIGTLVLVATNRLVLVRERRFLVSFGLTLPALYLSFVHTQLLQSDAQTLALLYLKTQVYVFVAICVFWSLFLRAARSTPEQLSQFVMASIVWAFAAQALFVLYSFVSPEFRASIDGLLLAKGNLTGLEGFRFKGLANSGGANLSMAMSFAAAMAAYLAIAARRPVYAMLALLILAASALVGRSGLVGFAVIGLAFLVRTLLAADLPRLRTIGALTVVGGLAALGVAAADMSPDDDTMLWWNWFSGEAVDSLGELWGMYTHDPSIVDLLVGKGVFEVEPVGNAASDPGYLKAVFAVGVPAALLFYAGLLVVYVSGARAFASMASNKRIAATFVALLVFLIFFYESKESMAFQNFTGRLMLFAFLLFKIIAAADAVRQHRLGAARPEPLHEPT